MTAAAFILALSLGSAASLDKGTEAVSAFQLDEAIHYLHLAREEGPYRYADHLRLYEQLGIAYTYLGDRELALEAFDMLLTLDPSFAISYTLSPKVTFVFEEARRRAATQIPPAIHLSWGSDQRVDQAVRVGVQVGADPKAFLTSAKLFARVEGQKNYAATDVKLPPPGEMVQVELPPQAPEARAGKVLQLYLIAYDRVGNEVHLVGDASRPRELGLAYEPPVRWYRKWWVWAAVGGVIATATGVTVYFATREPPDTADVSFK